MTSKSLVVASIMLAGILSADLLVKPIVADRRPACVRTAEWVARNSRHLPSSLEEIENLPVVYRAGVFSALSPEIQSSIIRKKYERFLSANRLTPDQVAVVEAAMSLASPDAYTGDAGASLTMQAQLRNLQTRIAEAFPRPEERAVFYGVTSVAPTLSRRTWTLVAAERIRSWFTASAEPRGGCNCYTGDNEGMLRDECGLTPQGQTPSCDSGCSDPGSTGCGVSGSQACDGRCSTSAR